MTSVRAVVFRGEQVLVFSDGRRVHILPGGRREPGESLEETLEVVYIAEATQFVPAAKAHDDFVEEAFLHPISKIDSLDLMASEQLFLDGAVALRERADGT